MSEPVLLANNVSKAFHDGTRELTVLTDVDLALNQGETVAVVGRSGTGKTTLLNCLGLLDRPTGGEISIQGMSAAGLSDARRTRLRGRTIGFVFQHYHLLADFSALENVVIAGGIAGRGNTKKARELLALVGLGDHTSQRPRTLSGGEQQRVAIARALMITPALLLCDEPTGNLDPATGAEVMDVLWDVAKEQGTAMILVTHDSEVAARADRVVQLKDGRLV